MQSHSPNYERLRRALDEMPVVDAHEHYFNGRADGPIDIFALVAGSYAANDLAATSPVAKQAVDAILDESGEFGARYELFWPLYQKAGNTGYFKAIEAGMRLCWGLESYSRESLERAQAQINERRGGAFFETALQKHNIRAMLVDLFSPDDLIYFDLSDGEMREPIPGARLVFSMPEYHIGDIKARAEALAAAFGAPADTLGKYVDALREHIARCKQNGVVALKDQSAYDREIRFDRVQKAEAERAFSALMRGEQISDGDRLALSDYLFRALVEIAGELALPVQIHTGYLAGVNSGLMRRTDAAGLASVILDYPNTRFDLFHGNYPMDESVLFMAKNYANVSANLCWAHAINAHYSVELMKSLAVSVPANKVIAFGGDCSVIEHTVGYLEQARDNVAAAFGALIDAAWFSFPEAERIARMWLFDNANELYALGLA